MEEKMMKPAAKREMKPRLRFPEFRDAGEWDAKELTDLIEVVTPPKKIPTTQYSTNGSYPIIDQSQTYISGWTDDEDAVISHELPLIVFGDHTCILKITDAPFAQGADGIKIFHASSGVSTSYLYQHLMFNPVKMEEYKRHFSILKRKIVAFPEEKSGEQQKIVDCLTSLDELITAEAQKLNALKTHKKGLMQQLFPAEGEPLPKLRFPEFRDAEEWDIKPLGEVGENLDSRRVPITEQDRVKGEVPYYGASGVIDCVEDFIFDEDLLCVSEDGANLVARTYPIAFSISGKTWVNNHAHVLRFKERSTQVIVENYLNSIKLDDFLTGMAQPKLNKAKLDIIPIPLPDLPEQQKIADCLSSIDELTTAQTQKLDALKAHKNGLMEQLFPVLDEVQG